MKYFLILLIATLVTQNSFAKEKMKTVYQGKLPLENLQVKLELPVDWNDPGEYTSLKIIKKKKVIFSKVKLQASKLENVHEFPANSQSLGQYLKIFPASKKAGNTEYFLAFSDWMGGSSDDALILLKITSNSIPKEVFNQPITVTAIKDYNRDDRLDILKVGGRGEPVGDNNFSYDPYLVYSQINNKGSTEFKIDESLSRDWSLENKFEWHGSKYEGKMRVDKNGKLIH